MRKLLSVTLLAALTAVTTGCECWDCFTQFEAWKNQTLFGCCASNTGACPPYATGYQFAAPQYAAPLAAPIADCGGMGVAADCGGVVVQSPYAGGCPGGLCAPAPQGMIVPGQTVVTPGQVIVPGQTVITPGTTVSPGPETYAPTM